MSSNRFPGKVLAPFGSYPIIENVYMRCKKIKPPIDDIIITTSNQKIDDPWVLGCFLAWRFSRLTIRLFGC